MNSVGDVVNGRLIDRLLDLALRIQAVPAPTFHEKARGDLLLRLFAEAGLEAVDMDHLGNVTGLRRGTSGGVRTIAATAHLDTVFPADTDLTTRSEGDKIIGPGIGDNSLGLAGLAALIWMLDAAGVELAGDLLLAANVREEGLGDLEGMRLLIEGCAGDLESVIVLEGLRLNRITFQAVGSIRCRLTVETAGGHSWSDFGKPSAIHALVGLAHRLTQLEVPASPRTTYNIGVIEGGISVNSIAGRASLLLDLRSEDPAELARLSDSVRRIVETEGGEGVQTRMEFVGERPAGSIAASHPLARAAVRAAREAGVEDAVCDAASTDANVPLSLGIPAVCIGLTRGGNAHRPDEYIRKAPLRRGLELLLRLVLSAAG